MYKLTVRRSGIFIFSPIIVTSAARSVLTSANFAVVSCVPNGSRIFRPHFARSRASCFRVPFLFSCRPNYLRAWNRLEVSWIRNCFKKNYVFQLTWWVTIIFINYLNLHRAGDSERCCLLGVHVDFSPGTSLPSVCLRSTDRLRWTL